MTLTSTRAAASGSVRSATAPRSPMCHECTTDLFLKIRVFRPSTRKRTSLSRLRRAMGRILRSARPSGGRVEYFCQKCGTAQHHTIPEGWEPTGKALTPCDVKDLASIYIAPGEPLPTEALLQPAFELPEPAPRAEKTLAARDTGLPS